MRLGGLLLSSPMRMVNFWPQRSKISDPLSQQPMRVSFAVFWASYWGGRSFACRHGPIAGGVKCATGVTPESRSAEHRYAGGVKVSDAGHFLPPAIDPAAYPC